MCFINFFNCIRKQRIRIQILIVQILTMSFVILILSFGIFISCIGTLNFLYNDAEQDLIMKFIYQSTNSQLQAYRQNQQAKLQQGRNQIDNFNRFYVLIKENKIQFTYPPEQCLQEGFSDRNIEFHLNQYCYGVFDCSQEISTDRSQYINDMIQLSSMMTSFVPTQESPNLYFTLISRECYFSSYPGDSYGNYVPSERPWFENHLKTMIQSNLAISEPYINIFNGVYQSLTISIVDNNTVIGIGAIDLNYSNIQPVIGFDQKFLVVTSLGEIIVSELYNEQSTEVFSLYNLTIFGFSNDDVIKILHSSSDIDSECEISIPYTFCATDQNTGILWHVRKAYISNGNWLLIMFTSTPYQNYLDILNSTLQITYQDVAFQIVIALVCLSCVCLTFNFITFWILQQPIEKLINSCNSYKEDCNFKKILLLNKHSDSLDKLTDAFMKLATISDKNNKRQNFTLYQELQQLQYPINYYRNSKISKNLNLIHNIDKKKEARNQNF